MVSLLPDSIAIYHYGAEKNRAKREFGVKCGPLDTELSTANENTTAGVDFL